MRAMSDKDRIIKVIIPWWLTLVIFKSHPQSLAPHFVRARSRHARGMLFIYASELQLPLQGWAYGEVNASKFQRLNKPGVAKNPSVKAVAADFIWWTDYICVGSPFNKINIVH